MRTLVIVGKYAPVVYAVLLCTHCFLLLADIDLMAIRVLCQAPVALVAVFLALNKILNLCTAHRLLIIYSFIINLCIIAERCDWFEAIGIPTDYARLTMAIVGTILIIDVLIKFIRYERKHRKEQLACCYKRIRRGCKI